MTYSRSLRLVPALLLLAAALPGVPLMAQTVAPGFCGFNKLTLPGNSDSFVSTPFARMPAASGLVQSVSGNQVTFKNSPDWSAGQFVRAAGTQPNTFYLQVRSGARESAWFLITGNAAGAVSVNLNGGNLSGLVAGDKVAVVPFWTLGTLFAAGQGVHASLSATERSSEVLFPDWATTTINAPTKRSFYLLNGTWLEVGQGSVAKDDEVLWPDSFVIVRHNIGAATQLMCAGAVVTSKLSSTLLTSATSKRDNYLALQRPGTVTLADSGLVSSGAFAASATAGSRTDELYVFDNAVAQKNKSASAIYYYWSGAWRKVGAGATIFNTAAVFTPGSGFLIRKNAAATSPAWLNAPTF